MSAYLPRRRFAALIVALIAGAHLPPGPAGRSFAAFIDGASFGQVNWYDGPSLVTANSSWGQLDLNLTPDPAATIYINVVGDAGNGQAWVVQNYPVFAAPVEASPFQTVYFDLRDLGVSTGRPLSVFNSLITVDSNPRTSAPSGPLAPTPVNGTVDRATGHDGPLTPVTGGPFGHKAGGAVIFNIQHMNVPGVQETDDNCITGGYARSIKWLDNTYGLKNLGNKSAQDIYAALAAMGIGNGTGSGKTEAQMLSLKANYLSGLDLRATTKYEDLSNFLNGAAVPGATQLVGQDLIDLLSRELVTEDAELLFDSHCVTVTGIYKQGGKTFLKYRDDEHQGDDTRGDTRIKEGELTKNADGSYSFNGEGTIGSVDYVVIESVPEPSSLTLLSIPLAFGLLVRRVKHRLRWPVAPSLPRFWPRGVRPSASL